MDKKKLHITKIDSNLKQGEYEPKYDTNYKR